MGSGAATIHDDLLLGASQYGFTATQRRARTVDFAVVVVAAGRKRGRDRWGRIPLQLSAESWVRGKKEVNLYGARTAG